MEAVAAPQKSFLLKRRRRIQAKFLPLCLFSLSAGSFLLNASDLEGKGRERQAVFQLRYLSSSRKWTILSSAKKDSWVRFGAFTSFLPICNQVPLLPRILKMKSDE